MPDVRLLLIAAGLLLAAISGDPLLVFDEVQKQFSEGRIIGPICSAMGYAWVLRYTGSDRDMVMFLVRPLRSASWLLIPGGALAGFVTNMAITSQTASAAAIGPILYPIMRAAGHGPITAAATILIGCSVGGNLFNPGEPDIVAITTNTGLQVSGVMQQVFLPNLLAFAVAVAVLILLSPKAGEHHEDLSEPRPLNLVKALLGPLPVVLLLILQPALGLAPYLIQRYPGGVQVSLVMLVCTVLVMLVSAGSWKGLLPTMSAITHEFFEGMGYAFANVISVIIAASCFIAGLNAVGLISAMSGMLAGNAMLAAVLAPALTWVMAVVGGSGTAPTVAFSKSMLPGIAAQDPAEAVRLGVAGAIGANVGRTMSPVAAVVLFTSTLTEVSIPDLWKRVAPCMLAAVGATIILGLFLRPS